MDWSLVVTDATGRRLPARLTVTPGEVRIDVRDAGAVYPLRVDPYAQQATLLASDGTFNDYFGESVAISSDGLTAVVGADNKTVDNLPAAGESYVYIDQAGTWTQQQALLATPVSTDAFFGNSIALSADGNTAFIAAFGLKVGANFSLGGVYVFTRSGSTWTQRTLLTASNGAQCDDPGPSISVDATGTELLAGAKGTGGCADHSGATYVFTGSGATLAQGAELTSGSSSDEEFGSAVALSSDGSTALVGAPFGSGGEGVPLLKPIVGLTGSQDGKGYRMVGGDGGVFAFGDAGFHGSLAGTPLSGAIVGIARTADGGGHWLVGTDGSIHTLGDAVAHGSLVGTPLVRPVDDIVPTADGGGYALVAGDGGLFSFGYAPFYGSGVGAFPGSTVIGPTASNRT